MNALFVHSPRASDGLQESKGEASGVQEYIAKARPLRALHGPPLTFFQDVAQNDVLVYMKGTPSRPQCGFSNMVCRILDGHGALLV